jgi:hypothetical protein
LKKHPGVIASTAGGYDECASMPPPLHGGTDAPFDFDPQATDSDKMISN